MSVQCVSPPRSTRATFRFGGRPRSLAGKRNLADYVGVGYISETEADELVRKACVFSRRVHEWPCTTHPDLIPG